MVSKLSKSCDSQLANQQRITRTVRTYKFQIGTVLRVSDALHIDRIVSVFRTPFGLWITFDRLKSRVYEMPAKRNGRHEKMKGTRKMKTANKMKTKRNERMHIAEGRNQISNRLKKSGEFIFLHCDRLYDTSLMLAMRPEFVTDLASQNAAYRERIQTHRWRAHQRGNRLMWATHVTVHKTKPNKSEMEKSATFSSQTADKRKPNISGPVANDSHRYEAKWSGYRRVPGEVGVMKSLNSVFIGAPQSYES